MNQPALGTLMTTSLMGTVGVLAWLFLLGDPCLGTEIANQWTAGNPPAIAPPSIPAPADVVVIENPYGIRTCDDWPTAADHALNFSAFVIVTFAIGWIAAWRITQRPLLAAAAISSFAMLIAVALQYWARWNSVTGMQFATIVASLVFFLVTAGIAMLGAWFALRVTRRSRDSP